MQGAAARHPSATPVHSMPEQAPHNGANFRTQRRIRLATFRLHVDTSHLCLHTHVRRSGGGHVQLPGIDRHQGSGDAGGCDGAAGPGPQWVRMKGKAETEKTMRCICSVHVSSWTWAQTGERNHHKHIRKRSRRCTLHQRMLRRSQPIGGSARRWKSAATAAGGDAPLTMVAADVLESCGRPPMR